MGIQLFLQRHLLCLNIYAIQHMPVSLLKALIIFDHELKTDVNK